MTDFDTVLERLLGDPSFAAALSADPATALAGYQLSGDEVALLRSQVTGDTGGQSRVETRANQSSVFGLLTPLAGLAGAAETFGHFAGSPAGAQETFAAPSVQQGFGAAPTVQQGFGAPTAAQGFGSAAPVEAFGQAPPVGAPVGAAFGTPVEGFGTAAPASYHEGFGVAAQPPAGLGAGLADQIDEAVTHGGQGGASAQLAPPEGYHTRVDVDGDGTWDRHRLRGREDGGVDILVDHNRDGRVDFIGHDRDADGLVDSAEYDKNHDGFFEKRMFDDNGDGWLDRSAIRHRAAPPADPEPGGMIGQNLRLPDEG